MSCEKPYLSRTQSAIKKALRPIQGKPNAADIIDESNSMQMPLYVRTLLQLFLPPLKHPFLFAVMKIIMGAYGNDAAALVNAAADANV